MSEVPLYPGWQLGHLHPVSRAKTSKVHKVGCGVMEVSATAVLACKLTENSLKSTDNLLHQTDPLQLGRAETRELKNMFIEKGLVKHTLSHTLSLTHTHALSLTLSHSLTHSLSHTHTLSHSHSHSHSFSLSLTLTHSHSR